MTRAELAVALTIDAAQPATGLATIRVLSNAGYVVVPKEPTERMLDACESVQTIAQFPMTTPYLSNPEECYRAMIAASQEDAE